MAPTLSPTGPGDAADAIGRAYDIVPYDPPAQPAFELAALRGAAAALGIRPAAGAAPIPALDVLDIGCGTGALLLRAASQSTGRMLGIDASQAAVAIAASRGASLGSRFKVLHADAATLDPAILGIDGFDVICIVGTLFVMPPDMRVRTLRLAAACLRPGGLLALTGYTGLVGQLRSRIAAVLRGENDPSLPPATQITRARANIQAIVQSLPAERETTLVTRRILEALSGVSDANIFHETLGAVIDPLDAVSLEATMAPLGIAFLNSVPPVALDHASGSSRTAQAFDVHDLITGGGYRTLLFAKPLPGAPPCGPRDAALAWHAGLRPDGMQDGQFVYRQPSSDSGVRFSSGFARAVLDTMIAAPAAWPDLLAKGLAGMPPGEDPVPGARETELDNILLALWRGGLGRPLWRDEGQSTSPTDGTALMGSSCS